MIDISGVIETIGRRAGLLSVYSYGNESWAAVIIWQGPQGYPHTATGVGVTAESAIHQAYEYVAIF
jgi:hypothetical protein